MSRRSTRVPPSISRTPNRNPRSWRLSLSRPRPLRSISATPSTCAKPWPTSSAIWVNPARERGASAVLSTVEDGFESIFSDFKKGVSATLDAGDYDTRYDLGIAYREMGLFEDAIGEFKICLEAPGRRFDSLYLMGLCARDLTALHGFGSPPRAGARAPRPAERSTGRRLLRPVDRPVAGGRSRARTREHAAGSRARAGLPERESEARRARRTDRRKCPGRCRPSKASPRVQARNSSPSTSSSRRTKRCSRRRTSRASSPSTTS